MDELISRQAVIKTLCERRCGDKPKGCPSGFCPESLAVDCIPSAQQWIPVTTRPMDEEERKRFSEKLGFDVEYTDPVIFECKMPDDGQEILVSYNGYISMDRCEVDEDCYYGLEENGDWYGVIAWMPLPEPYKMEVKNDE